MPGAADYASYDAELAEHLAVRFGYADFIDPAFIGAKTFSACNALRAHGKTWAWALFFVPHYVPHPGR
ncbi:hypothetical protein [Bradyrhizobium lablabi]|uniref:hypothetical protein n=1 Tax=Bradyrhizobium lablabi TaxID=722472 RepID=UPI001BA71EA7|nr:hypothetical protein [Bradyrhizobium lablabi]MBR0694045.1 hypothetical protein [Bradyrhizobium lablabi]